MVGSGSFALASSLVGISDILDGARGQFARAARWGLFGGWSQPSWCLSAFDILIGLVARASRCKQSSAESGLWFSLVWLGLVCTNAVVCPVCLLTLGPKCGEEFELVRSSVVPLIFKSIYSHDGRLLCSIRVPARRLRWAH